MPYRTLYGSHYHMTYGCHGATIPCDTNGLEPCSDCYGEDTSGTSHATPHSRLLSGNEPSSPSTNANNEDAGESEPSDTSHVVATDQALAPGLHGTAPVLDILPDDLLAYQAQNPDKTQNKPQANPIVSQLAPMTAKQKRDITAAMTEHFGTFMTRYVAQVVRRIGTDDDIVQKQRNNQILTSLMPSEEGVVYTALSRSFESALGKALETFGQRCAAQVYDTSAGTVIRAPLTAEQSQFADMLVSKYYAKEQKPALSDYEDALVLEDINGLAMSRHESDNRWYDPATKTHVIIELKAGGDLDNKKARSEKAELLREYFMQRNIAQDDEHVRIFFATAYNKDGEDAVWQQPSVRRVFCDDELLIGRDYWNLVCNASDGYEIIMSNFAGDVGRLCRQEFRNVFRAYGIAD